MSTFHGSQWVEVPERSTPVAASIRLQPTLSGSALTALYQLGPVLLEVQKRSGMVVTLRVTPDTLSFPFPINFLPLDAEMMKALWLGNHAGDRVVRVRIVGPGVSYLRWDGIHFYDVSGMAS